MDYETENQTGQASLMDYETIGSQRWVLVFASRPEAKTRKTGSGPARPFEATPYDRILLAKTAMEWLDVARPGSRRTEAASFGR